MSNSRKSLAAEIEQSLDVAELRRRFSYDPFTGILTHNHLPELSATRNARFAGKVAGYQTVHRYWVVYLMGQPIRTHRIIWCMLTGSWPKDTIDHINGVRDDNRAVNLRAATRAENNRNKGLYATNQSGFRGVRYMAQSQRWRADIRVDGIMHYIGMFGTAEEAADAFNLIAYTLRGAFYPGPRPSLTLTCSDPARTPLLGDLFDDMYDEEEPVTVEQARREAEMAGFV